MTMFNSSSMTKWNKSIFKTPGPIHSIKVWNQANHNLIFIKLNYKIYKTPSKTILIEKKTYKNLFIAKKE